MEKFGWSNTEVGFSLGVVGVCMIFVQVFAIRVMLDRYGQEKNAYTGMMCTVISFIGYAVIRLRVDDVRGYPDRGGAGFHGSIRTGSDDCAHTRRFAG
jgi:hypothetical protein|tara:strand:- start:8 stop:301 length:294 start_codon:yes stop_codon:yes gene_type:complete